MITTIKENIAAILSFSLMFIIIISLDNFIIWGMDGLTLWAPLLSEYVRGNYDYSSVIFGGQKLLPIYGELPFWKVLRALGSSTEQMLNLTYLFLVGCLFINVKVIYRGLSNKYSWREELLLILYCLFSPIITNRVYEGHFNLLFGMLPLLVSIGLIYKRSTSYLLFYTFCLWCSFSIQSYQILSYHLFYIPILVIWLMKESQFKEKEYWLRLVGVALVAIGLSFSVLKEILLHGQSDDNIRSTASNIVYSYVTSEISDIFSLFFSSYNQDFFRRPSFLFHELNYPLGLSLVIFFKRSSQKSLLALAIVATIVVCFLFSANIYGFNLISKLPIIDLFRVPQRSLMLPVFLLPLLFIAREIKVTSKFLLLVILFAAIGNWVDYYEFAVIIICIMITGLKVNQNLKDLIYPLIVSTFFLGLPFKWGKIIWSNNKFFNNVEVVRQLDSKLKLSSANKIIHFKSINSMGLTAAANYLGIRTVEGYGHPKKKLLDTYSYLTGKPYSKMTNTFSIGYQYRDFEKLKSSFGITDIIYVGRDGEYSHIQN